MVTPPLVRKQIGGLYTSIGGLPCTACDARTHGILDADHYDMWPNVLRCMNCSASTLEC